MKSEFDEPVGILTPAANVNDLVESLKQLNDREKVVKEKIAAINKGLSVYQIAAYVWATNSGNRSSAEESDGRQFFVAYVVADSPANARKIFEADRSMVYSNLWNYIGDKCFKVAENALVAPCLLSFSSIYLDFEDAPINEDSI